MEQIIAKYGLDADFFVSATYLNATKILEEDKADALDKISYTPTYVVYGIRLSGCDLNNNELHTLIPWIQKARAGDTVAKNQLIEFIFKEQTE